MVTKKKMIFGILGLVIVGFIIYVGIGIFDYLEWEKAKTAIATGGFPFQDAGAEIMNYTPECEPAGNSCSCVCCPLAFCKGYVEVQYKSQNPSQKPPTEECPMNAVCVPEDFEWKGGGTTPKPGGPIIVGGIAPFIIKVGGISK